MTTETTSGYKYPEYAPFYDLLKHHRLLLGLSRAKVAAMGGGTYYASDYSKLERGRIPPPNPKVILHWVSAFQLSRSQAEEFVRAAGYDPKSLLSRQVKFHQDNYPPVPISSVEERLYSFWPACELDPFGYIKSINFLAARLWGVEAEEYHAEFGDDITKRTQAWFLGSSFWTIISRPYNIARIAIPATAQEDTFWYTMLAVYNKQKEYLLKDIIDPFEQEIKKYLLLQLILEHGNVDIAYEWGYTLMILPDSPSLFSKKEYLEFQVQASRIMDGDKHTGYLIVFQPLRDFTKQWLDVEYARLMDAHTKEEYVQRKPDTHLAEEQAKYEDSAPV